MEFLFHRTESNELGSFTNKINEKANCEEQNKSTSKPNQYDEKQKAFPP